MGGRAVALGCALIFIGLLGYLTVAVIVEHGFDVLDVFALLVLGLFAFGIVGALLQQPPEE